MLLFRRVLDRQVAPAQGLRQAPKLRRRNGEVRHHGLPLRRVDAPGGRDMGLRVPGRFPQRLGALLGDQDDAEDHWRAGVRVRPHHARAREPPARRLPARAPQRPRANGLLAVGIMFPSSGRPLHEDHLCHDIQALRQEHLGGRRNGAAQVRQGRAEFRRRQRQRLYQADHGRWLLRHVLSLLSMVLDRKERCHEAEVHGYQKGANGGLDRRWGDCVVGLGIARTSKKAIHWFYEHGELFELLHRSGASHVVRHQVASEV
mmetsp:Transcript_35760/g.93376  ORF Transcript_35760/g.93376 Transcript_35760/m.93376 type:complete len:260 (+) Transcript_35760:941-1720(+)